MRFAQAEADRLEEQRLLALEERIDADLKLGDGASLVPELEALVAEHPFRERTLGQLMIALYRAGRQADALAAFRDGRRRLVEELGLEPGPELRGCRRGSSRTTTSWLLVGCGCRPAVCGSGPSPPPRPC